MNRRLRVNLALFKSDFTDEQKEYWLRKPPEAIRALNEAGYAICPRRFVVKRDGSHEPLWPEVQP